MPHDINEAPRYHALNEVAEKAVNELLTLSPKARIIILVEDNYNSIVKQSPDMLMADTMGLLHVCIVRTEMLESMSFRDRMQASKAIDVARSEASNEAVKKGNVN